MGEATNAGDRLETLEAPGYTGISPECARPGRAPRVEVERQRAGPWWNAGAKHMVAAMPPKYLANMGLVSLVDTHQRLQRFT